jgi:hypothetical protein
MSTQFSFDGPELSASDLKMATGGCKAAAKKPDEGSIVVRQEKDHKELYDIFMVVGGEVHALAKFDSKKDKFIFA